jgi:hypothetical protein
MVEAGVNPASWRVLSTWINENATFVAMPASLTNAGPRSQFKNA